MGESKERLSTGSMVIGVRGGTGQDGSKTSHAMGIMALGGIRVGRGCVFCREWVGEH